MAAVKNLNPAKDIPSLEGKVIFVTGGWFPPFLLSVFHGLPSE
jgi:hypothetical protein